MIFISHRSTDKGIVDMLVDFFSGTGISREEVFCSSLPGNDINEKISSEVKATMKCSAVNIVILSKDYYQSAYCLNEAGILWYLDDVPVIPIALPEIIPDNMIGFLNSEYKLRHLDSDTDIAYIYDTVSKATSIQQKKYSVVTYESQKLVNKYLAFLKEREAPTSSTVAITSTSDITTDDERIVLYYIIQNKIRKVSKDTVINWLHNDEIFEVNIDNAFDLLSSIDGGSVVNDTLELGIDLFRKYTANAAPLLSELKKYVDQHKKLSADTLINLWQHCALDSITQLFLCYIIDKRIRTFGDRWMAKGEISNIQQWENKNLLDSSLSSNYDSCLNFLIQNDLVYESSWTSYGNPREYSLYPSIQRLLFNCPTDIAAQLQEVKRENMLF